MLTRHRFKTRTNPVSSIDGLRNLPRHSGLRAISNPMIGASPIMRMSGITATSSCHLRSPSETGTYASNWRRNRIETVHCTNSPSLEQQRCAADVSFPADGCLRCEDCERTLTADRPRRPLGVTIVSSMMALLFRIAESAALFTSAAGALTVYVQRRPLQGPPCRSRSTPGRVRACRHNSSASAGRA